MMCKKVSLLNCLVTIARLDPRLTSPTVLGRVESKFKGSRVLFQVKIKPRKTLKLATKLLEMSPPNFPKVQHQTTEMTTQNNHSLYNYVNSILNDYDIVSKYL